MSFSLEDVLDEIQGLANIRARLSESNGQIGALHSRLSATAAALLQLLHKSEREPIEKFVQTVRHAVNRFADRLGNQELDVNAFGYGYLSGVLSVARLAAQQKVPEATSRLLISSRVAREIAECLLRERSIRLADLARRVQKAPQNVSSVVKDMLGAGLVRREEIGSAVRVWPTPLLSAALKNIQGDPSEVAQDFPRVTHSSAFGTGPLLISMRDCGRFGPVVDEYRRFLVEQRDQVATKPTPVEQLHAACQAAAEFRRLYPDVSDDHLKMERDRLVRIMKTTDPCPLTESQIRLLGSDPALYFPNVVRLMGSSIMVNVRSYDHAADELLTAHTPSPVAEQLKYEIASARI